MEADADVGGVNEDAARRTFASAIPKLQECVATGSASLPILSGEVLLSVRLGSGGKALAVWTERSTLGDSATEVCLLNALRTATWPPPVGGKTAEAKSAFEFERTPGVRAPAEIGAAHAAEALADLAPALDECRGEAPLPVSATVYLDEEGAPLAVGFSSAQPLTDEARQCLADALLHAQFPALAPGQETGKFSIDL